MEHCIRNADFVVNNVGNTPNSQQETRSVLLDTHCDRHKWLNRILIDVYCRLLHNAHECGKARPQYQLVYLLALPILLVFIYIDDTGT